MASFNSVRRPSTVDNVVDRVHIILRNIRRNFQHEPDEIQTRNMLQNIVDVERNFRRLDGVLEQSLFRNTSGSIAALYFEISTRLTREFSQPDQNENSEVITDDDDDVSN